MSCLIVRLFNYALSTAGNVQCQMAKWLWTIT